MYEVRGKVELPIKPFNLYVTALDDRGERFFISNLPLSGEDFVKDQTVLIFNLSNMDFELQ